MLIIIILSIILGGTSLQSPSLTERIDRYNPKSGAYMGTETIRYGADGRRLRWEVKDAKGKQELLFFVVHGKTGLESGAIYFEDGATAPSREEFSYSNDGRRLTTTYLSRSGSKGERTETVLDEHGREVKKRYYRSNGEQYGEEAVFWNSNGSKKGWDFTYLKSKRSVSFRYNYLTFDDSKAWNRRVKMRNGIPEQIEVRTLERELNKPNYATPMKFAEGSVTTTEAETSPSFTRDGKTMVFARYRDWSVKTPYIAELGEPGWKVKRLDGIGKVYNLAISPDGKEIFFSKRLKKTVRLFRIARQGNVWSKPENIAKKYGVVGTYPNISDSGNLYLYKSDGQQGSGIYMAKKAGNGFSEMQPLFVSKDETAFDPFTRDGKSLLVSRCFDDTCNSGKKNGIWEIIPGEKGRYAERKIRGLPYAWGSQIVEALGLFVYTDGEDILAVPLSQTGLKLESIEINRQPD